MDANKTWNNADMTELGLNGTVFGQVFGWDYFNNMKETIEKEVGGEVVAWCGEEINHNMKETVEVLYSECFSIYKDEKGYYLLFLIDYICPQESGWAWECDGKGGQTTTWRVDITMKKLLNRIQALVR